MEVKCIVELKSQNNCLFPGMADDLFVFVMDDAQVTLGEYRSFWKQSI